MRGDFDEDEFEDYELRPGVDYGDTVVEAGSTFDLDDATPLERGLYNMGREVEQLPASALQTRLSLLLSTAMIELWRLRQELAAPRDPPAAQDGLVARLRREQAALDSAYRTPSDGPSQTGALLLEAAERINELRSELESSAERDRARIAEVHEQQRLGQQIAVLRKERDGYEQVGRYLVERNAILLAERDALRAELANEERAHGRTIVQRDEFHDWADRFAAAIADEEEIGEHSSANNPWANALEIAFALRVELHAAQQALLAATDRGDGMRHCRCVDPENCVETIPGYMCRKVGRD